MLMNKWSSNLHSAKHEVSTDVIFPAYVNHNLGRPRRRWVDNIRMDLQVVGCGYGDWIGLAQDRDGWRKLVNAVMNLRDP